MKHQIVFLHQLRGISALLVVIYHHCHFFWQNQVFCGRLANHYPISDLPWIAKFLDAMPVNLGDLGVATFFLISGFLMPIVGQDKTRKSFLLRRILRIWPPYIMSLLWTLACVYFYSKCSLSAFPWGFDHVIASLFLMRDIGGYPFIDGIVWTLEIEIKFYLLCCLALPWLVKKPTKFILLIIGLSCLSFALAWNGNFVGINRAERLASTFLEVMKFICFIGLGAVMSYVYQGKMKNVTACVSSIGLWILYCMHLIFSKYHSVEWKGLVSYAVAYSVFILCYRLRGKFSRGGITGYIGNISYSLYLVHGVPGFVLMYLAMDYGMQPLGAIITALCYSILMGCLFYQWVENRIVR